MIRDGNKHTLLPTRLLNLGRLPIPYQPIMRLELLHRLLAVVDEREAGALAAAVLRAETEARDRVLGGFVEFREFLAQLIFGDVGARWVEDVTIQWREKDGVSGMRVFGVDC